MPQTFKASARPWHLDAVLYQIYPQSFRDSNGDGIGDLNGITQKLDYLQDLGVDGLWLSPIFVSPFKDAGYDVADYRKIAPRYGNMADFRRLVKEARKRKIRILLDLVFNHSSDEHPWFQESRKMEKNPYSKWYLWRPKATKGWWNYNDDGRHELWYSEFHHAQMSLNLGFKHLPKDHGNSPKDPDIARLHREFQAITAYWLDEGVGGFRCDVPGNIGHKTAGDDEGVLRAFWQGIRKVCDRYGDVPLIAEEWVYPLDAVNRWGFNMVFSMHVHELKLMLDAKRKKGSAYQGDPSAFDRALAKQVAAIRPKGHAAVLYTGNHDSPRLEAASGGNEALSRLFFLTMLTQNAVPKIYQGDEIGMLSDTSAPWKEWSMGRACARTPIQWTGGRNAGFSTADPSKLYLPVSKDWRSRNVERLTGKAGSLLEETRKLIRLRREHPALRAWGKKVTLHARPKDPVYAYARQGGGETVVVLLNFSAQTRRTSLDLSRVGVKAGSLLEDLAKPQGQTLGHRVIGTKEASKAAFELGAYGFQVFKVAP
jgi:maltose alpha-D-glucosyltransferase/alpha-amylase